MRSGRWGFSLTSEEAAPVGEAARLVGGYGELLRLERERRAIGRLGLDSEVVRDADGRYACRAAPVAPPPAAEGPPAPFARTRAFMSGVMRGDRKGTHDHA
jgi:hypothetical protein